MEITNNQIIKHINESKDINFLVTILKLAAHKSEVNTISEMARKEGCGPNTIRKNDAYLKINIGHQLMAIKIKDRIPYSKLLEIINR